MSTPGIIDLPLAELSSRIRARKLSPVDLTEAYLEVARQEYWKRFSDIQDYRRVPFILAHVNIDFRAEALVHEVLEIATRCEWIGTRSFAFVYEIREAHSRRLVIEAMTVQVCYDYEAKRSIPMPAELRRQIEAFEGWSLARSAES